MKRLKKFFQCIIKQLEFLQKRNFLLGVCATISQDSILNLILLRTLFIIFSFFLSFGILLYLYLTIFLIRKGHLNIEISNSLIFNLISMFLISSGIFITEIKFGNFFISQDISLISKWAYFIFFIFYFFFFLFIKKNFFAGKDDSKIFKLPDQIKKVLFLILTFASCGIYAFVYLTSAAILKKSDIYEEYISMKNLIDIILWLLGILVAYFLSLSFFVIPGSIFFLALFFLCVIIYIKYSDEISLTLSWLLFFFVIYFITDQFFSIYFFRFSIFIFLLMSISGVYIILFLVRKSSRYMISFITYIFLVIIFLTYAKGSELSLFLGRITEITVSYWPIYLIFIGLGGLSLNDIKEKRQHIA